MPKISGPIEKCPKCGAAVEDVRAKKKSDKSPDFKCTSCTDGDYKTGFWIEAPKSNGGGGNRGGGGWKPRAPQHTWGSLESTYSRCLTIAKRQIQANLKTATTADVLAATATLFIATKDGLKPEPAEQAESLNDKPRAFEESEDDRVPF